MIATLPMYDWPETREATARWWQGIARHVGSEVALSHPPDFAAVWTRPDLLFSQTCGYPFTHALRGKVRLVATPHYAVDGCDGPHYQSIVFARRRGPLESFRGAVAAVNTPDSMSGMLALKLVFAPLAKDRRFFGNILASGGHLNSLAALREGRAEVCAIDAVCVGLARRYRPRDLEGLVEIARSPMVPALPYITVGGNVAALRQALGRAFGDAGLQETRDQLFLSGFSVLEDRDYEVIVRRESGVEESGGLELQ